MDAIVHSAHLAIEGGDPEGMLVSIDMEAAFQYASRAEAMDIIREHLPDLTESFLLHYGSANEMTFKGTDEIGEVHLGVILATEGSVQGCPFGELILALASFGAVSRVQAEFGSVLVAYSPS